MTEEPANWIKHHDTFERSGSMIYCYVTRRHVLFTNMMLNVEGDCTEVIGL